ncbi:MAG: hypothetical protein ACHQ5A_09940 [Opitutales bacterium]
MKQHLKTILFIVGAGLVLVPALSAQETTPPPAAGGAGPGAGRREKMQERMIKALGLTADQQTKWTGIAQQQKDAMDKLRADSTVAPADRRTKAAELMKQFDDQRRALLTPDQQKKFDEMRAKQLERMKGHRENHEVQPPPPGDK